jgi:hypothetical protein
MITIVGRLREALLSEIAGETEMKSIREKGTGFTRAGEPIGRITSTLPQFFRVRQTFSGPAIADEQLGHAVEAELAALQLADVIRPGRSVAITAGSRGIHQIGRILGAIASHFKRIGAHPFVVPAMGSHGGATASGQVEVLESLGVTEATVGCPLRSSMETVVVCQAAEGFPVHFDRLAFEADHVFVCNRVKPHTGFAGDLQSGLMKMMLIGLGKKAGAEVYHRACQDYDFGRIVRSVAGEVLRRCQIVGALAIIENGYDQTALVRAVRPSQIESSEKELLRQAQAWMARLPFDEGDLLMIDEIGKNISGTGMDTNIVGRKYNDHSATGDEKPRLRYLFVRGLTEATHGNASGIGLAEFTLGRVVDQMDMGMTATNCVTANHPTGAMIPLYFETDREVLDAALGSIGLREPHEGQVMWITDTLRVQDVECSQAYWERAQQRDDLQILKPLRPLPLDAQGRLPNRLDWTD